VKKLKSKKIMILGIALILLGMACGSSIFVLLNTPISYSLRTINFLSYTALFLPWIGMTVTAIGLFLKDKV